MSTSKKDERNRFFRAHLTAFQLLYCLEQSHSKKKVRMLDVGGGHGIHARFFRAKGLDVDIVDMVEGDEPLNFCGDYQDYHAPYTYDVIWSSHVLEHIPNVRNFLSKMYTDLHDGGYLAVTVPPIRENRMAFSHLSFWNCGLLLLNASLSGFDPCTAKLAKFGYNVSLIIRKNEKISINSQYIKNNFPKSMYVSNIHFSGDIKRFHWNINKEKILHDSYFKEESNNGKNYILYYDKFTNMYYKCL